MNDDNKAVWCPTCNPDGSCTKHTGEGIPEMSEKGERIPIDRPCSACSAGDTEMEYHLHQPPFREMSEKDAPKLRVLIPQDSDYPDLPPEMSDKDAPMKESREWLKQNARILLMKVMSGEATGEDIATAIIPLRSELDAAQKEVERLKAEAKKVDAAIIEEGILSQQREQTMREEMERLTARIELEESARRISGYARIAATQQFRELVKEAQGVNVTCAIVHHPPEDRNHDLECPVVKRWYKALANAMVHTEETR